ncbi:hypothetical protein [Kangiella sp.]|uniref:hypothetical protein n=1 Tax=Kangiella sp. TaxID=1920245 RepID=UPI003A9044BB
MTPFSKWIVPSFILLFSSTLFASEKYDGLVPVDENGNVQEYLETGSSLTLAASGLEKNRLYEVRLGIDTEYVEDYREAVSFARVSTNARGEIPNFILWYHTGVVGCSYRSKQELEQPFAFRSFEEAREKLAGRKLAVSLHEVERDESGKIPPMKLRVGKPIQQLHLPVIQDKRPLVYPSDREACLHNSMHSQKQDLFISGSNFEPGEKLRVSLVPNQRRWTEGDLVNDITGEFSAAAAEWVEADGNGNFTVRSWDRELQRRGAYDIIVQREDRELDYDRLDLTDRVSYGQDTAFVLYLYYPPGGPLMDIAGRQLTGGFPYFEFADSFADQNDDVWGAVDPTYVQAGHAGGNYAAYYVVDHRSTPQWDPGMGGSTNLVDVSGGIEIMRVKSGCINGTDTIIWHAPLNEGEYDVVVDFGSTVAMSPGDYVSDNNYDSSVDFLDGSTQIGFIVADDPYDLGNYAIGEFEYSFDDYFATMGNASDVDLRAIVRYPATVAGTNTPVAAGQHPIFLIQHGNHRVCEISVPQPHHVNCPVNQRTPNHEGYMRLLETLASNGVIAVSIDAFDLSGWVPQWIPERGELILSHIELWSHMNNGATFPSYPDPSSGLFSNHVDMNKIAVSGHSRGGEASVSAYVQNTAFNIVAVSSIAPTDRYDFSNPLYTLGDIPYFVMLPAADGDVSDLRGIRLYDRAGSTVSDNTVKSGFHLYGANHNFFNTVWASHGDDASAARPQYIPAAQQQRIGEAYLAAFNLIHLKGESVYQDMLRGNLSFPSTAGVNNYHFHHEKIHQKVEAGSDNTSSSSGVVKSSVNGPSIHTTQALQAAWNASSATMEYSIPAAQQDVSGYEVLSFRVAMTNAGTNPVSGTQDFYVELVSGANQRSTHAANFDPIPVPYDRPGTDYNVMTTVRIPLHSFIVNNSNVDLTDIDVIRFKFTNPSQGEIYVDDIEFSR